jgi:radical SAM protein with 4Fe4S-binding SPASM domain
MSQQPVTAYRKHNSFIEIRHKHLEAEAEAQARIGALRGAQAAPSVKKLGAAHRKIFDAALADLAAAEGKADEPRFSLSPNVVEEISGLKDEDLPRYLVHRYRYEMFPQLHVLDDYPPYLQIEPSSICNYRCVFCFETDKVFTKRSNGFMGHMSLDTFKGIVDQAEGHVEFLSLASRGEPLLCPDIEPMLAYTRGKFLNLKLNTNASLLDEEKCHAILQSGIKTLVFSADAAEESLYSKLRVGGKLSVVLANVERFQRIRKTQYPDSRIITRVSGVKFDDRQDLDSMQKLWGDLADQVAFVNYNPWENSYLRDLTKVNAPCSDLWRRMFVWWDGKVNPCDVDYRSTLSVGSLADGSLSELWRSAAYTSLRAAHFDNRRSGVATCNRCTVV